MTDKNVTLLCMQIAFNSHANEQTHQTNAR